MSGAAISIRIMDREVKDLLLRIQHNMGDLTPAMKIIGSTVRSSIIRNFEIEGRPARWKPSLRVMRHGGKTLSLSNRLQRSINVRAGRQTVSIGTNVKYAAIHQFGGKTKGRTIRPITKKALFWPGAKHPVKSVRHPGSDIPARPFLMVQDEDWHEIRAALSDYILRGRRA